MSMFQNEKQVPRYFMMNNHLLSESCSSDNYKEYGQMLGRHKSDYSRRQRRTLPPSRQNKQDGIADDVVDCNIKPADSAAFEEIKVEKQNRKVESEGDAFSLNNNNNIDFFKLEDILNKSLRSKDTYFCLSEQDNCNRKCQH